ncbi:MAG: hypothetical protein FD180_2196 [Planctomycetota bacterium]|nr:MAG: hypothetical protein FD180_2196 [Planctomycetota bacterium]
MTLPEQLKAKFQGAKALWNQALDLDGMEVAAVLTLGLLLLHAGTFWYLTVPLTVICILGFALRPLLLNSTYWLLLAAIAAYGNFRNWYSVDNHKFLTTYWCIGLHCSLLTRDPRAAASLQGRLLIGLSFAFACFWKFAAPDFLSGEFFKYQMLVDPRFDWLASVVAGVPVASANVNDLRILELRAWDATAIAAPVMGGPRLALTAQVMTWWTIVIELLIATAFLAPAKFFLSRWKHPLLIAFVVTTYAVANVVGFGWLLLAMGVANCPQENRRVRGGYFVSFVFIHAFLIPFRNLGV